MKYLILYDINTDEEINRIELNKVLNISVMKGKDINKIAWMYGYHDNDYEEYLMIQFDNERGGIGFILCKKLEGYISFE